MLKITDETALCEASVDWPGDGGNNGASPAEEPITVPQATPPPREDNRWTVPSGTDWAGRIVSKVPMINPPTCIGLYTFLTIFPPPLIRPLNALTGTFRSFTWNILKVPLHHSEACVLKFCRRLTREKISLLFLYSNRAKNKFPRRAEGYVYFKTQVFAPRSRKSWILRLWSGNHFHIIIIK